MKTALKIASIVHIVVWIVIFALCLAEKLMYTAPPNEEPLGVYLTEGIHNVFIGIAVSGVLNSALLSACLHTFFAVGVSRLKVLKNTAFRFSVLSDLLLYLSVFLLFAVNRDWVFFVMLAWVICTLISLVLFIVLKIKKFVMTKNISDGSISLNATKSRNS